MFHSAILFWFRYEQHISTVNCIIYPVIGRDGKRSGQHRFLRMAASRAWQAGQYRENQSSYAILQLLEALLYNIQRCQGARPARGEAIA